MAGFSWRVKGSFNPFNVVRILQKRTHNQSYYIFRNIASISTLQIQRHSNHKEASDLYFSLIQQCKSPEEIKNIQTHMRDHGFPHLILGNKLMDAYLKCGSIEDAHQLFEEMPQRNRHVVAWNALISCYIKQKRTEEAVSLYKRMAFEGVCPDDFTLSCVLKAFSDLGFIREGQKAHGKTVVLGLEVSNRFVGSALVDMYAKFGQMRSARLIADRFVAKDVVLFTALIAGYVQLGEDHEAMEAFSRMIKEGVTANEFTFTSLLVSCGNVEDLCLGKLIHGRLIKYGYDLCVSPQTSLLTMYSKCGMVDDSLKVFEQLVNPSSVTWTSLIIGLAQNGREEVALSKFRDMICCSVVPNRFILSGALSACSGLAMFDQGLQIHAIAVKFGLDCEKFIGAALIDLYGRCGFVELAKLVYDGLCTPDVVHVNNMMYAYAQNSFANEALELFHNMRDMGLEPNDVTLVNVLSACNNAGLVDEGRSIFDSLRSYHHIHTTKEHYACMVDIYGRAGRLHEAESLINQVDNPDGVLWRTLLSACRIHGEVDMAERIINKLIELSPNDDGTLVLSSNLYASTGNWRDVIIMKSLMRENRMKKSPAMSWVNIDREVHTFKAGDCSHPRFKEISFTLKELMMKVKKLGYVPATRFVLQDLDKKGKEKSLYYHSEKLAIAFSIWKTSKNTTRITIYKNLRVCGDCHAWIKFVTKVVGREIVARDAKRFHHFKDGTCSCGDYW